MNFFGAILTLLFSGIVLAAPRREAVLGIFAGVCYLTQGQMIDVGGFHFTAIRIILLAAFLRTLARGELSGLKLNRVDQVFLAYTFFTHVISGLRLGVWQEQVGNLYNELLGYFAFRSLVASWEDLLELLPPLAMLILPLTACMFYESLTGNNVFNFMGGQGEEWAREGRYRCMGSFRGPHTAGIFGATLLPLFVGLFFANPQRRTQAVIGIGATTLITYTANSSGPLMAFLSSMVGLVFWRMRDRMSLVRRGIVASILLLDFSMKAPIWYIFSKISDITGGDGWYRSYLMEQCFNHIRSWWLWGTSDTSEWGATLMSWGGADLCNIYVSCAATAGLGCLILMITLLVRCFRHLGLAMQQVRGLALEPEIMLWCLGVALFSHVVTLFSVTYFDQMHVPWLGLLGMIASVSSNIPNIESAGEPALMVVESVSEGVSEPERAANQF